MENINALAQMIDHEKDAAKMFGKAVYEDAFKELYESYMPLMREYANDCEELDGEALAQYRETVGKAFIEAEEARLAAVPKASRKTRLYDDNLYMALFVVPAIARFPDKEADALADTLVSLWRRQYPQHPISKGNFEEIRTGFKKRKFCYITTAVCKSLGKPDDCEELTRLREYRDHWLMLVEGGPALVDEYYETAPAVLKAMAARPDYDAVCADVYERYIRPCLQLIEAGEYSECKELYVQMVRKMAQEAAA